ncbi:MAG: hypothetical protein GC193_14160 [Cryomorphaceae bacterium]|nr:hypothetical protein [Cryomorphaceae bacterium]
MVVVVNDTSVLIDLKDMGLLSTYTALGWELRTTDLIILELSDDPDFQQIDNMVRSGNLTVDKLDPQSMTIVVEMSIEHAGLSIQDCSVWYSAKQFNAILMTADQRLRKKVQKEGIKVHGCLHIIEQLHSINAISGEAAIHALKTLKQKNQRAPLFEIDKLIDKLETTEGLIKESDPH